MVHPILPSSGADASSEVKEKEFFKTANEFRIKKNNKKALGVYPHLYPNLDPSENEE